MRNKRERRLIAEIKARAESNGDETLSSMCDIVRGLINDVSMNRVDSNPEPEPKKKLKLCLATPVAHLYKK